MIATGARYFLVFTLFMVMTCIFSTSMAQETVRAVQHGSKISPTPMYWPANAEKGTLLPKGEKVHLRYRVLVHQGSHEEADIAGEFERYVR